MTDRNRARHDRATTHLLTRNMTPCAIQQLKKQYTKQKHNSTQRSHQSSNKTQHVRQSDTFIKQEANRQEHQRVFPSPVTYLHVFSDMSYCPRRFFCLPRQSVNGIIFDRRIAHLLKKDNIRQIQPEDYNNRGQSRLTTQSSILHKKRMTCSSPVGVYRVCFVCLGIFSSLNRPSLPVLCCLFS
jgi:hypothetical protein